MVRGGLFLLKLIQHSLRCGTLSPRGFVQRGEADELLPPPSATTRTQPQPETSRSFLEAPSHPGALGSPVSQKGRCGGTPRLLCAGRWQLHRLRLAQPAEEPRQPAGAPRAQSRSSQGGSDGHRALRWLLPGRTLAQEAPCYAHQELRHRLRQGPGTLGWHRGAGTRGLGATAVVAWGHGEVPPLRSVGEQEVAVVGSHKPGFRGMA